MKRAGSARPQRVILIFNPIAGVLEESPIQLLTIIERLQAQGFIPQVYIVQPDNDVADAVQDAYRRGIRHFVVSGGDGTIESVAAELVGTRATLTVIPIGTRNNVALSLNVPPDPADAVNLLRSGKKIRVDMGIAKCCGLERPFLEFCTVGLISALFPSADNLQKGDLPALGDFLSRLVSAPVSKIKMILDESRQIDTHAHVILISNMPYFGANIPLAEANSFQDGRLDVMLFAELNKIQLIGSAVQLAAGLDDNRIRRYRARHIIIQADPPMPVMADSVALGDGRLEVRIRRRALNMLAGPPPEPPPAAEGGSE